MKEVFKIKDNLILVSDPKNGAWMLKGNNGIYSLEDEKFILYMLPLLEMKRDDFELELQNKIKDRNIEKSFPFILLLKYPFENNMEYWSMNALNWVYKEEAKLLFDWAKRINTKWMSQDLRHKFTAFFNSRDNRTD
jgi:hypothetical protein